MIWPTLAESNLASVAYASQVPAWLAQLLPAVALAVVLWAAVVVFRPHGSAARELEDDTIVWRRGQRR